jgi:hypothetical protein
LAQCYKDKQVSDIMFLWQSVHVQMGTSRPYAYNADSGNADIDTTAKVYPIRVSADRYGCSSDSTTCSVAHFSNALGTCIKTTFGDYSCSFSSVTDEDRP